MKTIYSRLIIVVIAFSLASCTKTKTLKIEFSDISGLDEKSPILIGGLKVGHIKDFKVQSNSKILVEAQLDRDLLLAADAKFIITSLDILGSKGILIENGTDNAVLDFQTIQQGQNEKPLRNDSSVINIIDKVATKFSASAKLDSIESELHTLNKNIEKLKED